MPEASPRMEKYFSDIDSQLAFCYEVANEARSRGFDPEDKVDIPLTKTMAERVEGMISAVKPEIIGSGLAERIEELEKQHGELSLEVALVIADEVAGNRFCKFDSRKEAMEVGIRTGFAYLTTGIVWALPGGFPDLQIKKGKHGPWYCPAML